MKFKTYSDSTLKAFAEFWNTTGWKVAYAAIVAVAFVMLIVMFS